MSAAIVQLLSDRTSPLLHALGIPFGRIVPETLYASPGLATIEEVKEWTHCMAMDKMLDAEDVERVEGFVVERGFLATRENLFDLIVSRADDSVLQSDELELQFCYASDCGFPLSIPHVSVLGKREKLSAACALQDLLIQVNTLVQQEIASVPQGLALLAQGRKKDMVVSIAALAERAKELSEQDCIAVAGALQDRDPIPRPIGLVLDSLMDHLAALRKARVSQTGGTRPCR